MEGYEQFGTRFATDFLRDTLTFTRQKNAKDFRLFALNDYKKSYANTRKYNTKTGKNTSYMIHVLEHFLTEIMLLNT